MRYVLFLECTIFSIKIYSNFSLNLNIKQYNLYNI